MLDASLGIDYGTSNTVAVLRHPDGKFRPLLFDSSPLLPSAVFITDDGRLVVGRDAERSARLDPARFEPHPKRRIDDLDVLLGERAYAVTELVAAVLTRVRAEAARTRGGTVPDVTMTYPATWGTARRQVLIDAAMAAGLPRPTLVAEPVAAATYFASVLGHRMRPGQCVVVYDLGAGTFDASVVQRTEDGFRELSCRGLDDVGGVDLDALVVAHARSVIAPAAPDVWQRLSTPQGAADLRHVTMMWTDARHLREALSRESSASMFIAAADQEVLMTRQQFEAAAQPVLQRTVDLALDTLKQARVRPDEVVGWFLVGGGTRTPLVATLLHRTSGVAPTVLEEPQLVVAEGALYMADLAATPPATFTGVRAAPSPEPAPSASWPSPEPTTASATPPAATPPAEADVPSTAPGTPTASPSPAADSVAGQRRSAQSGTRFVDDLKLIGTVVERTRERLDDRRLRLKIAAYLIGAIVFTAALSWLLVTVF
ncbi:Hsp70 family protein [Dactylosporangium cerinum]|uniref:Hsp70 family protein n=1 Tax=Dactylosporangium cerinum TaxID=1434730 RepID=A0ABV9VIQ4_9ACTN